MAVSDVERTNEGPGAEGSDRTGAQGEAQAGGQVGAPAGAQGSVLVVDDDPTVSEVVAGYLERAGFSVRLAADGPSGLRAAEEQRPDLMVLDLMLPGMDGLEVCRRLRAGENGARPVPVIMLTARGNEDDRILGLEVGADDYVTKPFSPRELVLRVRSVLRRAQAGHRAVPRRAVRRAVLGWRWRAWSWTRGLAGRTRRGGNSLSP